MFLELDKLTVRFGRHVILDNLQTSVDSRSLGLLGPNGAGKSTLIRTVLGFIKPANGTARIAGLDIRKSSRDIRSQIGYMPEHESFIHGLSAVRLLRFMGELCGLSGKDAMERAHEILFYVGLGEERYRNVDTFSLGMQQKVKLAQALVHSPKLLILDEPTNALDPEGRREMIQLIRDIVKNSESHVILCSHILKDVEECCEDVLVLNKGKIILSGNIEDLRRVDERVYDLRIKGNVERFIAELSERGCSCSLDEKDTLRVVLPEAEKTEIFFDLARKNNIQLRHFYYKRDSLEDLFLKALQGDEKG
ncbi:MAG TPA: ABC transporter ATP-binding protein [Candidatus Sumerlaeota bacterium]|nr:MAG: putative ABC transporter ATP-binding protein YxlF [candidate division BRC1 bacterium ADurb.Bin183]HQH12914.1 ABC transporter ATP-binding protein [Candidatus Sumerlaeota bacterium]